MALQSETCELIDVEKETCVGFVGSGMLIASDVFAAVEMRMRAAIPASGFL
eukprot:CAMPEP_0171143566 /NCGR_PEP_ID=MMETSP0766_2-20121228/144514_1 /TAXON_ID=439317 /ORGANISM="Gambierdiscus australes, Strain CAWD 149" /LENGTH=50 /DNA_ID=CAMNT_0011607397 /DNA_START=290 /DNA_END=439 /DNA_ORIENTATION=+